jgi:hypothetical protein
MITLDRIVEYSFCFYQTLLACYPRRFQMRFGGEMAQVFRECCKNEAIRGGLGCLAALWTRTLRDFVISLVSEWRNEVLHPDSEIDYPGLADLFMITVVVGTNLLVWGWMAALVMLRPEVWDQGAIGIFGIVAFIFAIAIGFVCAKAVSRQGRPEPPRLNV